LHKFGNAYEEDIVGSILLLIRCHFLPIFLLICVDILSLFCLENQASDAFDVLPRNIEFNHLLLVHTL
jgi:hypothetical protein